MGIMVMGMPLTQIQHCQGQHACNMMLILCVAGIRTAHQACLLCRGEVLCD